MSASRAPSAFKAANRLLLGDSLAFGAFILLSLAAFAPELILGARLQDDDIYQQSIPVLHWYSQGVQSLEDVLWAPGILGGFPLAFTQYSLVSPLDWLIARLLDPDRAYALGLTLYLPASGVFSYLYARSLGISRASSLLAGVGYELTTEALALGANGYVLRSLFLLPAILLSVELVHRRGPRWAVLTAWTVGLSLLTGQVYVTAIALLNGGMYALARAGALWIKGSKGAALRLLGPMAIAVLVGIGLAAVRILPTIAVTADSVRSQGLSFEGASVGAPDLALLAAGYLMPLTRMVGLGRGELAPPAYVGPIVLLLAIAALFHVRKAGAIALLACLLLFNLLVSLGENGPLFSLLHQVPVLSFFRVPSRFTTASALFLSVLAAWALDQHPPSRSKRHGVRAGLMAAALGATAALGVAIVAGWLWLYGGELGSAIRGYAESNRLGPINPLRPRMALALLAIPTGLWLAYFWSRGNLRNPAFRILPSALSAALLLVVGSSLIPLQFGDEPAPATVAFLKKDASTFRVLSINPGISLYNYFMAFWNNDPNRAGFYTEQELNLRRRYLAESLAPNLALQYGLEAIDGYEVLQSRRQAMAMAYIGSENAEIKDLPQQAKTQKEREDAVELLRVQARSAVDHLPALRAFNVKYVLSRESLATDPASLRLVFESEIAGLAPGAEITVHVYEVVGALPRAYLVPEGVPVANEKEALDWLLSGQFDPSKRVMLETSREQPPEGARLDPRFSSVEMTSRTNSSMAFQVRTDGAGFLVVNDAHYAGWNASVDGTPTRIQVANGWVKAIPIQTPGEHSVKLDYVPPWFPEGLALSLASLAVLTLAPLLPRFRRLFPSTLREVQ